MCFLPSGEHSTQYGWLSDGSAEQENATARIESHLQSVRTYLSASETNSCKLTACGCSYRPSVPIAFVQKQLGLEDEELSTFVAEHRCVVSSDQQMDTQATIKELALLEQEQAAETARKKSGHGVDIHHID